MRIITYIKRKLPVLACGLLCTACSDFFDVTPENGASPDDFYSNNTELNAVAYGMYASLAPEVHKFFLWGSARADLVVGGDTKDTYVTEFINNNVSDLNPYTDYGFLYKSIARCNHQLKNLPRLKPNGDKVTATRLRIFYGEAYFLRAWCYFQLVRTFGEVPLILEEVADEVTFIDEAGREVRISTIRMTDEELRAVLLKPVAKQKTWMAILDDLAKARDMLDETSYDMAFGPQTDQLMIRANRLAAYELSADAALWCGMDLEASAFADYVLLQNKLGSYSVWGNQYTTTGSAMALNFNSFGFMYSFSGAFRVQRMQEFTSPVEADGGRYLVKPKMTICSNLFDEPLDARTKHTYTRVNRKDVIWKYIGLDDAGNAMRQPYQSTANWYLLKHAEAYLIKGIAENRLGNAGGALEMLNTVRYARGLNRLDKNTTSLDKEYLEDLLFKEKARETAFEGRRWYDLLLREEVFGENGIIARTVSVKYDDPVQKNEVYNRLLNAASWYLPIDPVKWK